MNGEAGDSATSPSSGPSSSSWRTRAYWTFAQGMGLADALEAAASEVRRSGRRLVVVIDGLDHVWRDKQDLGQMELLFDALLPLPEGVRLLVGTQRVEDKHLPRRLLRALPKDQWTELPTMSVTAVREWLTSHAAGERLRVAESHGQDA